MIEGVLESKTAPLETLNLASRALSVLESNWLGHGTRPSLLYPHQWSWDSACIAMGYARWNQGAGGDRAAFALRRPVGKRPRAAHRLRGR